MLNLFILQGGGGGSMLGSFLPLIIVVVIIYFFFIRPQAKKQKEQNNFLKAMKKGDEVVTASGMVGRINKIEGNMVTLQVDQKTFIRVLSHAISKEMSDQLEVVTKEGETK
ncbi:MAG TPA: preprotein translocase subunit YajC [Saprospiraceae bacterium]|nr:preprotein translocase subunit YajC [Saprospiraceae bacterium]